VVLYLTSVCQIQKRYKCSETCCRNLNLPDPAKFKHGSEPVWTNLCRSTRLDPVGCLTGSCQRASWCRVMDKDVFKWVNQWMNHGTEWSTPGEVPFIKYTHLGHNPKKPWVARVAFEYCHYAGFWQGAGTSRAGFLWWEFWFMFSLRHVSFCFPMPLCLNV